MSAFQLVFGLVSIITSLALTHLLAGFVGLLRNSERVRFSAQHALWAWSAFASTIGNWATFWEIQTLTSWPAWTVLLAVGAMISQYVFCAFVTPQMPTEGEIDLSVFHQRERRRYIFAFAALCIVAIVFDLAFGQAHYYADWWRDSAVSALCLVLALLAVLVAARWLQIVSAAAVAALLTYFMITACNVIGV